MSPIEALGRLLAGAPETAAPRLLGAELVSMVGGEKVRMRITEVEAYKGGDDPASHAFRGPTARNASMFDEPGTLYVYRSYGIHHCANTAAGPAGIGWGILIRAGEIVEGVDVARRRRGRRDRLAAGPGMVCQALAIDLSHDGTRLLDGRPPLWIEPGEPPQVVVTTGRVGISKAQDRAWRFVAAVAAS
jgi:DNA-3-methyladenine glycosylase